MLLCEYAEASKVEQNLEVYAYLEAFESFTHIGYMHILGNGRYDITVNRTGIEKFSGLAFTLETRSKDVLECEMGLCIPYEEVYIRNLDDFKPIIKIIGEEIK